MDRAPGSRMRPRLVRSWRGRIESLEERQLLTIDVTGFSVPMVLQSTVTSAVKGPDGNLWFTESGASKIGVASTSGKILHEYSIPAPLGTPLNSITVGHDGALYFAELQTDGNGNPVGKIGRITTSGQVTEFPVQPGATIASIAAGSDGNIWFTENDYSSGNDAPGIGRMTPDGKIATFAVPGSSGYFGSIVAGADGNLWFTDNSNGGTNAAAKIGRITTSGITTEFPLANANAYVNTLSLGPDGNVWYAGSDYTNNVMSVGKVTPTGVMTEFTVPKDSSGTVNPVLALAPGSNGDVFFAQANQVGYVTPSGTFKTAALPSSSTYASLNALALGSDGNVWYATSDGTLNKLGQVTPALAITEYTVPPSFTTDPAHGISNSPGNIVRGSDGALWFTTSTNQGTAINRIGVDGSMSVYPVSTAADNAWPSGLTLGPDGNIWFALQSGTTGSKVGKITPKGVVTTYSTPGSFSPSSITTGTDGNLWSAGIDATGKSIVMKVTTSGVMKTRAMPAGVTLNGPMIFAPGGKIYLSATRQTTGKHATILGEVAILDLNRGKLVELVLPKSNATGPMPLSGGTTTPPVPVPVGSTPTPVKGGGGILASPTSPLPKSSGATTSSNAPTAALPIRFQPYYQANAFAVGPDGNVWAAASASSSSKIIRIKPNGRLTSFDVPGGLTASAISVGSDGNLWFSANHSYFYPIAAQPSGVYFPFNSQPASVGRVTTGGAISLFTLPSGFNNVGSITTGPDGKLWFTDFQDGKVAKFDPPALLSGSLDPKDATGSLTNATTDARPTFDGVGHPNATVMVYATNAQGTTVPIGTTRSNASGSWTLRASKALPDGTYQVFAGETTPAGLFLTTSIPLAPFSDGGPLVIDTHGPKISAYSYNTTTQQVSITFTDTGAGFSVPSDLTSYAPVLGDTSNYSITEAGSKIPLSFTAGLAPGSTSSSATVVLSINDPTVGKGPINLHVFSKNFLDRAGNALDGEYRGKLPSGNGKPGGDFVANVKPQANS